MKLEELIVNGTAVKNMDEIKKAITEFWERIGGMYDSVEMNKVSLAIERKINEHMDVEIGRDEIAKFVKTLKNGKAAGMDGISYEFYKEGGCGMIDGLYELFKKMWVEERVPRKWNESKERLLYKRG